VDPGRLRRVTAAELGAGPWGEAGSPTVVGATRPMEHERALVVLDGPVEEQVRRAVVGLVQRGALQAVEANAHLGVRASDGSGAGAASNGTDRPLAHEKNAADRVVAVLAEPGRPQVAGELL